MDSTLIHSIWVDGVLALLLAYFVVTSNGFIATFSEVISFVVSLLFSYRFFGFFGNLIHHFLSIPTGFSNSIGFFVAWFICESILYTIIVILSHKYLLNAQHTAWNKWLGFVAAILQTGMIFLFFISLVFALPVKGQIKQDILNSHTGPFFVNISQSLQSKSKTVFGGAVSDALNFLAVEPQSGESVNLGFKLSEGQMSVDEQSENTMITLLNKERTRRGLRALTVNPKLTELARSYGEVMFENGFFAHVSAVDGSSPGDRAKRAGIDYMVFGENLAFAPDVYLAHQGLMNSPGHRANILSADYGQMGIGVIDGGVYGKMFVQEFEN